MKYRFGSKIRRVREKKGLTLKNVADKLEVSESLLSQIERDKISPAIDTLLKIIDVLEIDLDYIFSDFKKEGNVILVRKDDIRKTIQNGVTYYQLSRISDNEKHEIEAYILEIQPDAQKGSSEYGHPGKELGYIIEGSGEFTIGKKSYILNEGDSISFSASVPHILRNTSDKVLRAFWVVTPPKMIFGR
ncbi:MAG: helix-turn-helix domain-containing protein [Brevinematia bacterium]